MNIKKGQQVFIKPSRMEKGEEKIARHAVADSDGGRVMIVSDIGRGALNPIENIDTGMLCNNFIIVSNYFHYEMYLDSTGKPSDRPHHAAIYFAGIDKPEEKILFGDKKMHSAMGFYARGFE